MGKVPKMTIYQRLRGFNRVWICGYMFPDDEVIRLINAVIS